MDGPYLRHIRSKHLLDFDHRGVARVHARCDCAVLQVSREQSAEMMAALSAWKVVYWAPHLAPIAAEKHAAKINSEFDSHFRPSAWQRFLALLRRRDNPSRLIGDRSIAVPQRAAQEANSAEETAKRELLYG